MRQPDSEKPRGLKPSALPGVIRPLAWVGDIDGHLDLLDQTRLPNETVHLACNDVETLWEAIRSLRVRGAPAIGCAAAYGVVLGLKESAARGERDWRPGLDQICRRLAESRPTAVNLFWAIDRMRRRADELGESSLEEARQVLLDEAHRIRDEDAAMCRAIGMYGADLIRDGSGVMTHCNAGALATAEYGTALAVIYSAYDQGRRFRVFSTETRPLLQGARLTTWELLQHGVDVTLICDSAAAQVMREGKVNLVVTGADRIAANGDTANKIGTYALALLARDHGIPFYVAAPSSTFDLSLADGTAIPIEQRDPDEIRRGFGIPTAPAGTPCYAPAFDVTPAGLIHGIITEKGLIGPVTIDEIGKVLGVGGADAPVRPSARPAIQAVSGGGR
jgi:methylthioribose-1-phosphate isomerase